MATVWILLRTTCVKSMLKNIPTDRREILKKGIWFYKEVTDTEPSVPCWMALNSVHL